MEFKLIKDALIRLCHSFIGSEKIALLKANGISDCDLEGLFKKPHSDFGGSGGPGQLWMHYHVTKAGIKVWIGETPSMDGKPTFENKKLFTAVRQALDLPFPDGFKQNRFFD